MRKTIQALLIVGSVGALCGALAACATSTPIDDYFKQGNVIMVTYDGSGGSIKGQSGAKIVDMFNPDKYTADENGYIHIKLREFADRPSASGTGISVARSGYSLVGWYQNREVVKVNGSVVDEKGNALIEKKGVYYIAETGVEALPAYTFSDPWDFQTDTIDFKVGDEKLEKTLYAAWVPYYSFEYYHQVENEETHKKEWTMFGTTRFDYLVAQTIDREKPSEIIDSVFVPQWSTETGKMEYKYNKDYTFPCPEKMTFKAAYSDEACQNEITRENPLQHPGSLDYKTAAAIDPVQKIYVEFDEGTRYRISTAKQFADIGDPDGYYTILADELDFNCLVDYETGGELNFDNDAFRWPVRLTKEPFTGKIEGEGGKSVVFKNVGARYNESTTGEAIYGGLFGEIAQGAVIKNVTFENVIFDIEKATGNRGAYFGMLAGNIEEGAALTNVTISGQLRLWEISVSGSKLFNLIANGNKAGISAGEIKLIVCGMESLIDKGMYLFDTIDPDTVKVDENGNFTFKEMRPSSTKENQYYVKYGGSL